MGDECYVYPSVFGAIVLALIVKELAIPDKRLSTMLTFLIALVAHWLSYWFASLHYLPLIDLIHKLS